MERPQWSRARMPMFVTACFRNRFRLICNSWVDPRPMIIVLWDFPCLLHHLKKNTKHHLFALSCHWRARNNSYLGSFSSLFPKRSDATLIYDATRTKHHISNVSSVRRRRIQSCCATNRWFGHMQSYFNNWKHLIDFIRPTFQEKEY